MILSASRQQPNPESAASLMGSLAGQLAVVTGASSGIGRAIAEELAARGAFLCLLGRRPEVLRNIAPQLEEGVGKFVYRVDLDSGEIGSLPDKLLADCGGADILVHSAGMIALGTLENATFDDFDRQLNVNLKAPFRLTQALLPQLKSRRGQVVFINSSAGVSAVAGSAIYSASKYGLKGLADSLRAEVNGLVRVTSLFAGTTATPMQESLHADKGRAYAPETLIQPKDVASVVGHLLSLPRTVEIADVHMRPALPPR
jgi:NADP-dependent 3-hydroxy acid dehydrogenase YdfG